MKKVVCLGGGNAMPNAVLREIKNRDIDLCAISAVLDSGGSSGRLREEYDIIAVGDIRRALLELSALDKKIKEVFEYRFKEGELKGHNLGNLVIVSILLKEKDPVKVLNKFFKTKFKVLPITLEKAHLRAELENKEIIVGETNIDIPKHKSKIKRVFLDKEVHILEDAYNEILKADAIIIGPGDLYSSLIQILLVLGTSEAIKKSGAKVIYVCNLENKKGETDNFKVHDFEREIEKYLEMDLDYVVFNNKKRIDLVEFNEYNDFKHIGSNLLLGNKAIHDSKKLVNELMKLI